ncbi:hypothetical protein XI03_31185 [Bradyrhizobium sp. CCBAU 65884]|uniref:FCD domain-containing protein n=1 Tax=Bradyrhizobium sp. CCBAU 65884 TaxID=722477 RepID=UPI0023056243|nr:FCD domain-containing protein [Bradyrhizobium sp. CCBAU 65884]MDA9478876.1 hypothetical protein [Bradyrhizobium sp. CCBAU 65884]
MTIQLNPFAFCHTIGSLARQEKVARYRKHLYMCAAHHAGHSEPSLSGKTSDQVVALFWQECAALSMLNAGPAEEDRLESAVAAIRFSCAVGADCTKVQRSFHQALLEIADHSFSASFRQIWSFHAPLIVFPTRKMAQGRAIVAIRHLHFYANHGNDDAGARAMTRYLDLVLKASPTTRSSESV